MDLISYRFAAILFFLMSFGCLSHAENFRVRKVHVVELEEDSSFERTLTTGINDGVCVRLPEKYEFIEGIEVKVQIPSSVSAWRDSVAFSIYDGVKPSPRDGQIDYSGTRLFLQPLPSKVYWICQIPLGARNSLKDSAYTTKIGVVPDVSQGFAFIRFMPVMKGVPEETLNAVLGVTVRPCLVNRGRLSILLDRTLSGSDSPVDIFIDDNVYESDFLEGRCSLVLEPGLHNVSVQSASYRSEVRSVMVEQAKVSEVKISLRSLSPRLSVTAPDTVDVFLDGAKISASGKEFEIEEGEHKIRFALGSYEVVRNINAEKGRTYSATLNVDLQILEE